MTRLQPLAVGVICLGWITATSAQNVPSGPPPPVVTQQSTLPPDPFDGWRRATVAIGDIETVEGRSTFVALGSALIIADGHVGCLLTAKHMFSDKTRGYAPAQVNVRVPPAYGQPDPDDPGFKLELMQGGNIPLWKSPDDSADIAVIRVPSQDRYPTVYAISASQLGTDNDVYQGASVYILGYPKLFGEYFRNSPILRGGIIAWTDPAAPTGKPFLVDANLYPGNSGGPVFNSGNGIARGGGFNLGAAIRLIGIVSQGVITHVPVLAGGAPVPVRDTATGKINAAEADVAGIGGIAEIEPISTARSLLTACLSPAASFP